MNFKPDYYTAPINEQNPYFTFPKFSKNKLSENTVFYNYLDANTNLLMISVIFKNPTEFEKKPGIAYLATKLLTQGTEKRDGLEFVTEIDYYGSTINCTFSKDYIKITLNTLKDNFNHSFELLNELIEYANFDETEVEKMKSRIIAAIETSVSNPNHLNSIGFYSTLFKSSEYAIPDEGYLEDIRDFKSKHCKNWFQNLKIYSKVGIIISGNLNFEEAQRCAELLNNNFDNKEYEFKPIEISNPNGNILSIIDFPDENQIHLAMGKLMPNIINPHYPELKFISTVLGGYFSSRINLLLREKRGVCYGAHSSITSLENTAFLSISSSLNMNSIRQSYDDIIDELVSLSNQLLPNDEISLVKNYISGQFLRSITNFKQVSSFLSNLFLYDLEDTFYNDYYNKLINISAEDLFNIQIDYFKPENLAVSLVGSKDYILEQFHDFDKVLLLDTEGKLINSDKE